MEQKIVLFGPPLCGKRTLLKACADPEQSEVRRRTVVCGSESMPHEIASALLTKVGVEVVTIGGAVWNVDAWWPLFAESAAVVLMLDSQRTRDSANREHVDALAEPSCPRVGCVVWTKADLVTTHGLERVAWSGPEAATGDDVSLAPHERAHRSVIRSWPTFFTRFDDGASMLAPVQYLTGLLARRG